MKDYFKARICWRGGLKTLSDAEAGRFCKALWDYAATGEVRCLDGREGAILSMCLEEMRRDAEHLEKVSQARSRAGTASGISRRTNMNKKNKSEQNEHMLTYVQHEEKEKPSPPRPPISKEKEVVRACAREGGDGFLTEAEADSLARALQEVYDAAERVGFPANPATLDKLTELAAAYSPARVLDALDVAAERGKSSVGYLRGILAREAPEEAPAPPALPVMRFDREAGEPAGIPVPGLPGVRLV